MILDELDISIIKQFYFLEEEITTWKIMKNLFPGIEHRMDKRLKHIMIKRRIHRMDGDLFEIKKIEGRFHYTLVDEYVKFCKHKFPCGMRDCIMIFSDEKWIIFQI